MFNDFPNLNTFRIIQLTYFCIALNKSKFRRIHEELLIKFSKIKFYNHNVITALKILKRNLKNLWNTKFDFGLKLNQQQIDLRRRLTKEAVFGSCITVHFSKLNELLISKRL
ncbi:hypothetical protein BpHYR1_027420 [Brachionus plicatilis]|uniref:Uncharacterized protein n=1 Tax=Brachionus plicatilis TaxID=10195 RepID=A0A3M7SS81_BRAPC|nr:hypothetical protein BpHYR1_027420 [Brachionus plicatilis]